MSAPEHNAKRPAYGPDGLTDADRQIILDAIARYPEIEHVWLFGSRATQTFGQGSDIDLALSGNRLTRAIIARLAADLDESRLPYKVDLLHRTPSLDPAVEAHIQQHGKPFGWKRCTLGEVTVNHDGRRIPVREADRKPGPFPYYGASGVVDHVDGFLFDGLHLLIAEDGENLRTRQTPVAFLADGRFWVNNHAHIVTGNERANTRFLCYALAVTDIGGYLTGSAMPKLTQRAMNAIEVPLPPINTQRAIVELLGSLDDKIEQNRRTGSKLEGLARGVFKAWFVDFEPVKAKAAGATAFPGMPPETFATLPTRLTNSDLGPVPEGWEVKPLPEVIDFLEGPGIRNWQYTNSDEGTRFINIRCIKDRELDVLTANRVTDAEAYGKYKHFLLAPDDIVVSTSGTLGRFALVTNDDLPLMLNTSVIRMRPIEPFTTLPYLLEYIGSREFQLELETRASGSVQKNFGPMHLRQISLLVPPTMILKSHSSLVTPLLELGKALRAESRRLAALRDYLLPRLLSGRVRVNSVTCLPESMEVS